ncbi:MAG: hypothetical protein MRZ79_15750 [Bacteroidia bacterium]|nr:hypothetical protein [Bacteroidia bacterium]
MQEQRRKIKIYRKADFFEVSELRKALRLALLKSGHELFWEETELEDFEGHAALSPDVKALLVIDEHSQTPISTSIPGEEKLISLLEEEPKKMKVKWDLSMLPAIGLVFLPKCPLCWAAYAGIFSGIGLDKLGYQSWWLPFLVALFSAFVGWGVWKSFRKKNYSYILLITIGACCVLCGKLLFDFASLMHIGIGFLFLALIWLHIPYKLSKKIIVSLQFK